MRTIFWQPEAAIAAGVPFAPPVGANYGRIAGVAGALLLPATSGAVSNPIFEAGVPSGAGAGVSGAAGAGQITFNLATQQFAAGDGIAVSGAVFINVYDDGALPVNQ